jgi:hypothetical protein
MLPPESALPHANSGSGESSNQHHSIIHSGPVTIHRPGVLRPARRWLELTADMVTSYPRADESGRIRPIRCVLCKSTLHSFQAINSSQCLRSANLSHSILNTQTIFEWSIKRLTVSSEHTCLSTRNNPQCNGDELSRVHYSDTLIPCGKPNMPRRWVWNLVQATMINGQ